MILKYNRTTVIHQTGIRDFTAFQTQRIDTGPLIIDVYYEFLTFQQIIHETNSRVSSSPRNWIGDEFMSDEIKI